MAISDAFQQIIWLDKSIRYTYDWTNLISSKKCTMDGGMDVSRKLQIFDECIGEIQKEMEAIESQAKEI